MSDTTLNERVAVLTAHRICHNIEHDGLNGKQAGCCIVCGVPWPCAYAGTPTTDPRIEAAKGLADALREIAEGGESCRRCEGNGRMWADGQAHYPSENLPTTACGDCGGSGRMFTAAPDIATAALAAWEKLQ